MARTAVRAGSACSQGHAARIRTVPDPPLHEVAGGADPVRFWRSLTHADWTVLLCGPDGSIGGEGEGLWDLDCRILSLPGPPCAGTSDRPRRRRRHGILRGLRGTVGGSTGRGLSSRCGRGSP
jgi:hypothetical protein